MEAYKHGFIDLAIEAGVLKFGEFKLKSGRTSPYFFNAGLFSSGGAAAELGRCYAEAIVRSGIEFDMLFGPAYKGIPLVALTAAALAENFDVDVPYAYNRKEAKTHGEGGSTVGAPIEGRVLVVDDVITAGTAVREAFALISELGADVAGLAISLDRQERGQGERSAVQELQEDLNVPVVSIIRLEDLIARLKESGERQKTLKLVLKYRENYGI